MHSPDQNPNENLLAYLKKKLGDRNPLTLEKLLPGLVWFLCLMAYQPL